jgi:hypothetical protein
MLQLQTLRPEWRQTEPPTSKFCKEHEALSVFAIAIQPLQFLTHFDLPVPGVVS